MPQHLCELPESNPKRWKELNQRESVAKPLNVPSDPEKEPPFLDKTERIDDSSIPLEAVANHALFGQLPDGVVKWDHEVEDAGDSDDERESSGEEAGRG